MGITLPSADPGLQQLIYVKTNIAGYFFDAVLKTDYTRSLTITGHPVETGASIADHSYINPVELVMQIGMSDVAKSIVDGQFTGGSSRSLTAFQVLAELQSQRVPVQVMTRLGSFNNMLVQTIAVPDDNSTLYGLKATVTLKEIFVATVKKVKVSARPHVTDNTNKGTVNPEKPNQSTTQKVEPNLNGSLNNITNNSTSDRPKPVQNGSVNQTGSALKAHWWGFSISLTEHDTQGLMGALEAGSAEAWVISAIAPLFEDATVVGAPLSIPTSVIANIVAAVLNLGAQFVNTIDWGGGNRGITINIPLVPPIFASVPLPGIVANAN